MALSSRNVVLFGALTAAMLAACTPSPASKMMADKETIRRETTAERLAARAEGFASIGDLTRAEQYFAAAIKAGADEKKMTQRLLAVCVADGRYPVALMYADDYLRHHPTDTDVRYAQASICAAIGDTVRAREGLERVVVERPALADAHYALASLIRQDGDDMMSADLHYREYLRLEPNGRFAEAARSLLLKSVP